MPSLDAVRASPHRPVVVTPDASVTGPTYDGSSDPARQLPINGGGFEVDSGMFKVGDVITSGRDDVIAIWHGYI